MSDLFGALTSAVEGAGWLAIPAALVWGILSIVLSPCHLTSVPLVIGYINRGEAISTRRAVWTATCFAGGVLVTLAIAGGIALAAGRLMGQTGIWGNLVVAVVLLVVGLYLLGVAQAAGRSSVSHGASPSRRAGGVGPRPRHGTGLGPCTFAYLAPVLAVVFDMSGSTPRLGIAMLAGLRRRSQRSRSCSWGPSPARFARSSRGTSAREPPRSSARCAGCCLSAGRDT